MPKRINYSEVIEQHLKILSSLRTPTGLFRAAAVHVDTGYDKAWLRDNFYECLAYLDLQKWSIVIQTYNALLEIFLKHEYKIDHAIANKPPSLNISMLDIIQIISLSFGMNGVINKMMQLAQSYT